VRAWLLLVVAAACNTSASVEVDPFPVGYDLDGGVPLARARAHLPELGSFDGGLVVIDTASPLTILDLGQAAVSRRVVDLTLLEPSSLIARARFRSLITYVAPVGAVGLGASINVRGVLGGDALSRIAVRLDPAHGQLHFFPDIAGDDTVHEDACEAVIRTGLAGGGTIEIEGGEDLIAASRLVVGACLAPMWPSCLDPLPPVPCDPASPAGADPDAGPANALLVVATGVPVTVISRSAYTRATGTADAEIDALPETYLFLTGGDVNGEHARLGTLPRLGLVAPDTGDRSPCTELWANRAMALHGCSPPNCPFGQENTGTAGAAVEIEGPITVAILPDTHPLLQGLRHELRPRYADIDGLLGMDLLRRFVLDIDYPNGRLIFACNDTGACITRGRMDSARSEELVTLGCLLR
jgi:hypothetical protein